MGSLPLSFRAQKYIFIRYLNFLDKGNAVTVNIY